MNKLLKSTSQGFSLIEVLFAVAILAFILTAMLAMMLRTVNTFAEAKFRAAAIAKASSCLDEFRKARNAGWVRFCNPDHDPENTLIPVAQAKCNELNTTSAKTDDNTDEGSYTLHVDPGSCSSDKRHVSVEVCWSRFSGQDPACGERNSALVEQTFYRYQDEQSVG
jgi:prepilin-type N-terminal cleavage/methylation domain-containing protein